MSVSVYSVSGLMQITLGSPNEFGQEVTRLEEAALRNAKVLLSLRDIQQKLDSSSFAATASSLTMNSPDETTRGARQFCQDPTTLEFVTVDSEKLALRDVRHGPVTLDPVTYMPQTSYTAVWNGRCVMIWFSAKVFIVVIMPRS